MLDKKLELAVWRKSMPRIHAMNWTPFAPHGIGAIGTVGVTIFFAFFGWEAICHLSAEFKDPARAVPAAPP